MHRSALSVALTLMLIFNLKSHSQESQIQQDFRIMFYNVENLFDPFHDTLKNDYAFVAGGEMGWTWKKFEKKINNISKVIINAGGWQPPEIIGFSEIENRNVLIHLIKRTPLERFGYNIIHEESPDERGIDVGLIYLRSKFQQLHTKSIPVKLNDSLLKTRSILYVKGLIKNSGVSHTQDTLHLFINHWPSRTGGISSTMHRRKAAAISLKNVTDSLTRVQPNAQIILMGDFNDEPTDESLSYDFGACTTQKDKSSCNFFNLMTKYVGQYDMGTNKFREQWGVIDQFIVARPLVQIENRIQVEKAEILSFPFLLKIDEKYSGTIPFRTYSGMKYIGGYSDHLPILLTLIIKPTI